MRVLIAPDGFKGSLTATEAAAAMAEGWRAGAPRDDVESVALSDGGPGFLVALDAVLHGRTLDVQARDPFGRPVGGHVLVDGAIAYVESSEACGLHLVDPLRRRPGHGSTAGVADLVRAAAAVPGVHTVVVGLGGSATNDGGAGLLDACGIELRDGDGEPVEPVPARLATLDHVVTGRRWESGADLVAASDVDSPLLGVDGATAVYGAQKGVRPEELEAFEGALSHLVATVARDVPGAAGLETRPGAGAAGGLGYGLFVLGADRRSGIDLVLEATRLAERVQDADVVLTGEGSFDTQSLRGKVVAGVAGVAQLGGTPCIVLAGRVALAPASLGAVGITAAYSMSSDAASEAAARAHPARHLCALATHVARRTHADLGGP